jgi:hypothetical protein
MTSHPVGSAYHELIYYIYMLKVVFNTITKMYGRFITYIISCTLTKQH